MNLQQRHIEDHLHNITDRYCWHSLKASFFKNPTCKYVSRFRIPERKWLFLPLLTGWVPNKTFPSTQFHIWWSRSAARSLKSFSFLLSQFQIAHSINVGRGTLSWIFDFCNLLKLPFKRDFFYNILLILLRQFLLRDLVIILTPLCISHQMDAPTEAMQCILIRSTKNL